MNTQAIQSGWSDLRTKIKTKWSKFSDSDIEGFKDNLDKVSGQIQKTYGIAKELAEREFNDFKATLSSTKTSDKVRVEPLMHAVKPQLHDAPRPGMVSEGKSDSVKKAV